MAAVDSGETYHNWLAKINQVCGHFAARPLEGDFHGEIDTSYAGSLKLSTVTSRNVNLYRTRQRSVAVTTPGFTPCFNSPAVPALSKRNVR